MNLTTGYWKKRKRKVRTIHPTLVDNNIHLAASALVNSWFSFI
jgi:hypothetical protein